jgi:DNA-binding CsgD family transcriptional regulator
MGTAQPNVQLIDSADSALRLAPSPFGDCADEAALAGVISAIGTESFGPDALVQLNRWMPVCWWSIYCLFDGAPPSLHALGSFGVPDGTRRSWQVYRDSLYRADETFHAARAHLRERSLGLMHWHARDFNRRQRDAIYSRHGLSERLSIVAPRSGAGLLAINLYRHESQPAFSDHEIDRNRRFSKPLLACVERHIALHQKLEPGRSVLLDLTNREREVCERLLKGWTHDGIAADLAVSPATVKTYRDRAFDRLGIHHRNELFAMVMSSFKRAGASTDAATSPP